MTTNDQEGYRVKIAMLYRYPVKSMLGESVPSLAVDERGAEGDRQVALIDVESGRVATAKHPRLWRSLLRCAASNGSGAIRITLPNGRSVAVGEPGAEEVLSEFLGRPVRLSATRPAGAVVARPDPEDVLAHGVEADVEFATVEIARGTPGTNFVDYAPLHVITTATLEHIGVEAARYRPNIVIATPRGTPPYVENDWAGGELRVEGSESAIRLRGSMATPRCAVPTLEHGELPRAPQAVRRLMAENRVDLPDRGVLPCAGVYLDVLNSGTLRVGARVSVSH